MYKKMKRNIIIQKLVNEGFSEKTLSKFTDKQILTLSERILSEEDVMISKKDPQFQQKIATAKKQNKTIETYEQNTKKDQKNREREDNEYDKRPKRGDSPEGSDDYEVRLKNWEEMISKKRIQKKLKKNNFSESKNPKKTSKNDKLGLTLKKLKEHSETKEWVNKLVENNYHSLTTKDEIMELIKTKLNESETMIPMPNKPKKGHKGIPEFMTYDAITSSSSPQPTTKPVTKPTTKPTPKPKPRTPFNPGPKENPGPSADTKQPTTKPVTKPTTKPTPKPKPKPRTPFNPGPKENPGPSAGIKK